MSNFEIIKSKYLEEFKTFVERNEANNYQSEVDIQRKKLVDALKGFFEEKKDTSKLWGSNTYGDVKYFEFKSRTKGCDSLSEKLLRTNFVLSLLARNISDDFANKSFKKDLDDLIGVRMLCWVQKDVENAWAEIKENNTFFLEKGIEFSMEGKQPREMKNGFEIYRIKGFINQFPFELQIKSRFEDAWAEIEHSNFYKKPRFTRERQVFQNVLNKNFEILKKVDEALEYIREGSSDVSKIELYNSFESISEKINSSIKKELDYEIDLLPHMNYILSKSSKFNSAEINLTVNIEESLLGVTAPEYYKASRKLCWDLIFIESLYCHNEASPDFSNFLDVLIDHYLGNLSQEGDNIKMIFKNYLTDFWIFSFQELNFFEEHKFFLDIDKFNDEVKWLKETLENLGVEFEDVGEIDKEANGTLLRDTIVDYATFLIAEKLTKSEFKTSTGKLVEKIKAVLKEEQIWELVDKMASPGVLRSKLDKFGEE